MEHALHFIWPSKLAKRIRKELFLSLFPSKETGEQIAGKGHVLQVSIAQLFPGFHIGMPLIDFLPILNGKRLESQYL